MNREEFMALHRHWIWANVIKKHFETEIAGTTSGGVVRCEELLPESYGAYMSIWYGMLYGALEVLRKKGVSIPQIQNEINGIFDSLRLYRNAVFHPQPKYFSPKLFEIMKDPESVNKIWTVHNGLGEFFLEELRRLDSGKPGMYVR